MRTITLFGPRYYDPLIREGSFGQFLRETQEVCPNWLPTLLFQAQSHLGQSYEAVDQAYLADDPLYYELEEAIRAGYGPMQMASYVRELVDSTKALKKKTLELIDENRKAATEELGQIIGACSTARSEIATMTARHLTAQ